MNVVVASTPARWRAWLARHGRSEREVWLVTHHRDSGTPSVRHHEAMERAAVPADLREMAGNGAARRHFERFPPSSKRLILEWIATAKRPETRQRRVRTTVELAAVNVRANHPTARAGQAAGRRSSPRTGPG